MVSMDLKPLLGILGDKVLTDMDNPRLLKMKEKMLCYSFKIIHTPGLKNKVADAAIRYQVGNARVGQENSCSTLSLQLDGHLDKISTQLICVGDNVQVQVGLSRVNFGNLAVFYFLLIIP